MPDPTLPSAEGTSVAVSQDGVVGWIEIQRPDRRNAIDIPTAKAVRVAIEKLGAEPECRGILLSGQGGDLSSGADLNDPSPKGSSRTISERTKMLESIRLSRLPVVAAVDGWAVGLGVAMAAAATAVVAGPTARFRLPEATLGFFPTDVADHLYRRMQPGLVVEWVLSGRVMDVAEAHRCGLVDRTSRKGEAQTDGVRLLETMVGTPRSVVEDAMTWFRLRTARDETSRQGREHDAS